MEHLKVRKQPSQSRSKEKVKKVLDAAAQLLVEQGIDSVTTPHIAEVSGVTVGSIYQYFPNKESILHELYQQWLDSALLTYAKYSSQHLHESSTDTYFAGLFRYYFSEVSEHQHRLSVEFGTLFRSNKELQLLDSLHAKRLQKAVHQDLVRMRVLPRNGKTSKARASRMAFFSSTFLVLMDMVSGSKPEQRENFVESATEIIRGLAADI